jgi:hypothetical protein
MGMQAFSDVDTAMMDLQSMAREGWAAVPQSVGRVR